VRKRVTEHSRKKFSKKESRIPLTINSMRSLIIKEKFERIDGKASYDIAAND